MSRYSAAFKQNMIKKLLSPNGPSASALSQTSGVSQAALSRWLRQAASLALVEDTKQQPTARQTRRPEDWPPQERLRVVREVEGLADSELGAFLRREGLHEATVAEWREQALAALGGKRQRSREQKRIRLLERELDRKDKALAETAALLVLAKKARALWGEEDGDTTERSGP